MANAEHLAILRLGVEVWNRWREQNRDVPPDLKGALLVWAELTGADLSGADLSEAHLSGAHLSEANLNRACLRDAELNGAVLSSATLREADLTRADLTGAYLNMADLSDANLRYARVIQTNLPKATLSGCQVYGTSVWGVDLEGATQVDLVITPLLDDQTITVDNLEVAQFIYLLVSNEKIREVIDTITSKVVLILGRFTPKRKAVLDAIREALRHRNYLPVMFDFDKPASQTTMETVSTLAHMARFIIADLSYAKSVLQELQGIVPQLPSVPVQPLIIDQDEEPAMLDSLKASRCFLEVYRYKDLSALMAALGDKVIGPAEAKVKELRGN